MIKAFSKIWIVIILVVFIAGGVLAWQYWWMPKRIIEEGDADWKTFFKECEVIQDPLEQFYCFNNLFSEGRVRDEIFCKDFPTSELQGRCFWEVAKIKKDMTLCERINKEFGWMIEGCKAETAEVAKAYSEEKAKEIIENRTAEVILAIKNKDIQKLSNVVHPDKGIRFSPYAYVNITKDLVFSADQIRNFFKDKTKYIWGIYDGIGTPIELTPEEYFNRFIYDADFANAKEIGYNRILGRGNTINNAFEIYPNSIIVEYYFPGFVSEYGGMDWIGLRLVFEEKDNVWYLTGIIHDQWTI